MTHPEQLTNSSSLSSDSHRPLLDSQGSLPTSPLIFPNTDISLSPSASPSLPHSANAPSVVAIAKSEQTLPLLATETIEVYPLTYAQMREREKRQLNPYPFLRATIQVALSAVFGIVFILQSKNSSPPRHPAAVTSNAQAGLANPSFGQTKIPPLQAGQSRNVQGSDRPTQLKNLPKFIDHPLPPIGLKSAQSTAPAFVDRLYIPKSDSNPKSQTASVAVVDRYYLANSANPQGFVVVDRFYATAQPETQAPTLSESRLSQPALPTVNVPDKLNGNSANAPFAQFYALVPAVQGLSVPAGNLSAMGQAQIATSDFSQNADRQALAVLDRPALMTDIPSHIETSDRSDYKLLGVLELGSQSAALFQTSTNTYSTRLGEQVGNSNWVVTSLVDGKAVLQRNHETRSLSIGDSF